MARTGIRPPAPEALKAKCCECCAAYGDGRYVDCEITACPLYNRMPYRKLKPNYDWVFSKWTRTYKQQRLALGLSEEQFIQQHLIGSNNHLRLGYTKLFRAKCYRCCGDFRDGRVDCEMANCSLYYWMPYRKLIPTLDWLFDLPYTRRHKDRRLLENLSREEYIQRYIAKQPEEEPEEEPDESSPSQSYKVRTLL